MGVRDLDVVQLRDQIERRGHACLDHAGRDGVDADAIRGPEVGGGHGERDDSRLGGRISGHDRDCAKGAHRGDVHHARPSVELAGGQERPTAGGEAHRTGEVEVERLGEHVRLPLVAASRAVRSRVVHEDVQTVETASQGVDGGAVGEQEGLVGEPRQVDVVLLGVGAGSGDRDVGPRLGEEGGRRQSDAARPAGDEDVGAREVERRAVHS
jgi:hypothetical protein